ITQIQFSPDGEEAGLSIMCEQLCSDGASYYRIALLALTARRLIEDGLFFQHNVDSWLFTGRKNEMVLATDCETESISPANGELRFFDFLKQAVTARISLPYLPSNLVSSQDGRRLVFTARQGADLAVIELDDVESGRPYDVSYLKEISGGALRKGPVRLSPDGN